MIVVLGVGDVDTLEVVADDVVVGNEVVVIPVVVDSKEVVVGADVVDSV